MPGESKAEGDLHMASASARRRRAQRLTKPPQRAQTERKHYSTQAGAVAAAREHLQKLKGNATVRRSRLPPKRLTPPASSRGWGRAANRDRLAALSTPRAQLPPLELHPGQTRSARHVDGQRLEALSRPVSKPTKPEMSDPHSGKTFRVARLEKISRPTQRPLPPAPDDPHAGKSFDPGRLPVLAAHKPKRPEPAKPPSMHAGCVASVECLATLATPVVHHVDSTPGPGTYNIGAPDLIPSQTAHLLRAIDSGGN